MKYIKKFATEPFKIDHCNWQYTILTTHCIIFNNILLAETHWRIIGTFITLVYMVWMKTWAIKFQKYYEQNLTCLVSKIFFIFG